MTTIHYVKSYLSHYPTYMIPLYEKDQRGKHTLLFYITNITRHCKKYCAVKNATTINSQAQTLLL